MHLIIIAVLRDLGLPTRRGNMRKSLIFVLALLALSGCVTDGAKICSTEWHYYTPPKIPTRLGISCHQRLALGPEEWLGHGCIEVGNEALDPLLEMLLGGEVAAAEEFAHEDREPNLDLVEPRGVLGREVEGDPVAGVAQECLACRHRLKDTGLSLLSEIFVDAAQLSHQADNPFGH